MNTELIGIGGFAIAIMAMSLIHATKERVTWPGWLFPVAFLIPFVGLLGFAVLDGGFKDFFSMLMETKWGVLIWYDRLMSLTVAYYLLQNRARAAGIKSDLWVIAIAVTGNIALFLMLSRMVYLEANQSAQSEASHL